MIGRDRFVVLHRGRPFNPHPASHLVLLAFKMQLRILVTFQPGGSLRVWNSDGTGAYCLSALGACAYG
ncbi:hypothetical protein CEXT_757521 [Caerostris extrusa]|uniref:Uncharacterized protein n=1 Tax=Caerostris extrusa TaxID=172846 RepID=A0AAV4T874_CAEEX|nr:hypothetical protein CEXT_757521 [Caerostris extrusa]